MPMPEEWGSDELSHEEVSCLNVMAKGKVFTQHTPFKPFALSDTFGDTVRRLRAEMIVLWTRFSNPPFDHHLAKAMYYLVGHVAFRFPAFMQQPISESPEPFSHDQGNSFFFYDGVPARRT